MVGARTSACGMRPVSGFVFPIDHYTDQHHPYLGFAVGVNDIPQTLDPVPADVGLRTPRAGRHGQTA